MFFCDVRMVRAFSKSIIYEPFYCHINNFSKFFVSHRWSILSPSHSSTATGTMVRKIHKKYRSVSRCFLNKFSVRYCSNDLNKQSNDENGTHFWWDLSFENFWKRKEKKSFVACRKIVNYKKLKKKKANGAISLIKITSFKKKKIIQ